MMRTFVIGAGPTKFDIPTVRLVIDAIAAFNHVAAD
jgi:hypothetical protein